MTHDARPIILVGFPGTGKTSVGQVLAQQLGRPFIDLDQKIETEQGMTVAEIFSTSGELVFRQHEVSALQSALAVECAVIATGGGAACRQENLNAMLAAGHVVALEAPVDESLRRIGRASGRPLLDGAEDDPQARMAALLRDRQRFYRQAHVCVSTAGKTVEGVAAEVLRVLARTRRRGEE